ncbi:hypothetical protein HZI30_13770 [Serratia fonticola]|uniref:hypothetical protein n=1 Tax=Serratia fonticola TaxID=47917 RepID=UPI0015C62782|nr:hypothetical protein [Serratia fonticola]NXZ88000.1 hypothetical protein [Serratia fonticola]
MSTFFYISESLNIGIHSGASYCILEGTRSLFDSNHEECLREIYEGYDVGMGGVTLEELEESCYNYFYQKCKAAMNSFPDSEHAGGMAPNLIAGIMAKWVELLEILRKDPRYKAG